MQTFLPYADYSESALVLDKRRQNKQITEVAQILDILEHGGSWENHPAVRMWRGYSGSLVRYAEAMFNGFVMKGGSPTHKSWRHILLKYHKFPVIQPPWLSNEEVHSSHRARLLHKGNLDVIEQHLHYLHMKPDIWLPEFLGINKKVKLREVTVKQASDMLNYFWAVGCPYIRNWYTQFNWSEEPLDNYVWPA